MNQLISAMLSEHGVGLSKEVLDLIREDIKSGLSDKIETLVRSAFEANEEEWFRALEITQEPTQDQLQLFVEISDAVTEVYDMATYDEDQPPEERTQVSIELLEEISRLLF